MTTITLSLLAALFTAGLLVRLTPVFLQAATDQDLSGPQKFHSRPVPRVGGVAVVVGVLVGVGWLEWRTPGSVNAFWLLLICSLPTLVFGLWEDFTKSISPRRRLVATAVSALLAVSLLGVHITRTHIPGVDAAITWYPISVMLTVLVVTGVANAINIIDGFNGLAAMCSIIMLAGVAFVAHLVGDGYILAAALVVIGGTFGFFILNYPAGLIFLGDGGAYFLGFVLSVLGISLVERNAEVSPLFPLLLCGYPIFETLFSIYRKKFVSGISPSEPDRFHLHMLVYRRVMRVAIGGSHSADRRKTMRNSLTSPYLWILSLFTTIPAVLFWDSTPILSFWIGLFIVTYVTIYWSIVRFRTPRWLVVRKG
jgi:UDP-N-acetylmuramyl pentapeptide phosphotransferase/UDP-N-acetylglucosamine-1-phosphate transferase